MQQGDKITVTDDKGNKRSFVIDRKEVFKTEEAPLEQIFGPSADAHLNLITCTGKFN
jgi:3-dehydroquinate synthase class II